MYLDFPWNQKCAHHIWRTHACKGYSAMEIEENKIPKPCFFWNKWEWYQSKQLSAGGNRSTSISTCTQLFWLISFSLVPKKTRFRDLVFFNFHCRISFACMRAPDVMCTLLISRKIQIHDTHCYLAQATTYLRYLRHYLQIHQMPTLILNLLPKIICMHVPTRSAVHTLDFTENPDSWIGAS